MQTLLPCQPHRVFNIAVDQQPLGLVSFEFFADKVPKTAENFCALSNGEKGLGYKGSCFHIIISGFICQGGDFKAIRVQAANLSMGRNYPEAYGFWHLVHGKCWTQHNATQFFIGSDKTEWSDSKHAVCGQVKDGINVVVAMERFWVQEWQDQ